MNWLHSWETFCWLGITSTARRLKDKVQGLPLLCSELRSGCLASTGVWGMVAMKSRCAKKIWWFWWWRTQWPSNQYKSSHWKPRVSYDISKRIFEQSRNINHTRHPTWNQFTTACFGFSKLNAGCQTTDFDQVPCSVGEHLVPFLAHCKNIPI